MPSDSSTYPHSCGKFAADIYKLAPSVGDAVSQQDLHSVSQLGCVPRQGIAHLNGHAHLFGAMLQQVGEVLTRVLPPSEEQSDLTILPERYDAAGEDAGALV